MTTLSTILAPCRSLCHASFGVGGGRFAIARSSRRVMGGGFLSQLLCRADVHERMPHGEYLDYAFLHAVVDPVIVMAAENLADFGAVEFGKRLAAKLRVGGKLPDGFQNIVFKLSAGFKIEVVFQIFAIRRNALLSALCDDEFHTAVRSLLVFDLAMRSSFVRRARISLSKSSIETTSPRSASPSATRRSSYASIFSIFSWISSQVEAFTNTPAVRPFCVTMMGRPVSRVCVMYPARFERNSLRGRMSSFALKLIMISSFLVEGANIVQNSELCVKEAA